MSTKEDRLAEIEQAIAEHGGGGEGTYIRWLITEVTGLRADNESLRAAAGKLDELIGRLTTELSETEHALAERDAEIERLRKIERAARAAVETERILGYVSLTLLSDVLDES